MSVNLINLFQHELYNDPEWVCYYSHDLGRLSRMVIDMNVVGDGDDLEILLDEINRIELINYHLDMLADVESQKELEAFTTALVLKLTKEAAFEEGELYHNRLIDAGMTLVKLIDKVTKQLILERGDLSI